MSLQIQIRRDTATNWTNTDPLLAQGELGYEIDSGLFKVGNGEDPWSSLEYYQADIDGTNLGSGEGIYTSLSGTYMQFKSIVSGDNITLTSDGNTITISGTPNLFDEVLYQDGSTPLSADWDAGDYRIASDGFDKGDMEIDLAGYANITGLLTGGALSVNGIDNTLLDVASGTSIYVNMSDRSVPIVEEILWASQTLDPTLSGVRSKWAGVQRTAPGVGTIIFDTDFTQLEKRTTAVLGRFWGSGGAEISTAKSYATGAFSFGKSMEDLTYAIGSINISGNDFTASATPMKLDRSAGESFRWAGNYGAQPLSPNVFESSLEAPRNTYQYHIQGLTTTEARSTIDPDYYDNSGVKTAVPSNKWTVQRVFYFPVSNTVHVVYGQDYHDSKTLAIDDIPNDNPVINIDILSGSIFRAYLIVKQGATDLTDDEQAKIIKAYGYEGLFTGVTNHGELGGLEDDDHSQYHNDTRGDVRYYTQTQIDTLSGTLSQAESISYVDDEGWGLTNIQDAMDEIMDYVEHTQGTGRISPIGTTISGYLGTTLYVNAGEGYINRDNLHRHITWEYEELDVSGYDRGTYYIYVDENGDKYITDSFPGRINVILLGFFYVNTIIGVTVSCGCMLRNSTNRMVDYMLNLGTFLTSDSGEVQVASGADKTRIVSPACIAQYGLTEVPLPELSSDDSSTNKFISVFMTSDYELGNCYYFNNATGWNGSLTVNRYNDYTTYSGAVTLSGTYTFTQYSPIVTVSGEIGDLELSDLIWLGDDPNVPSYYETAIASISGSVVTLEGIYVGPGGTGTAQATKSIPYIPEGKWGKHLIGRTLDGHLVFLFSQGYWDSEEEALNAGSPIISQAIEQTNIKMAYVVCSGTETDLTDRFVDIRPLPFHDRYGGNQSTGGSVATDHGALTGLGDDDHTQYILSNGSRNFISKVSYMSHPTFTTNTDLVDKKYVDDKQHDHGGLAGLGDDDHTQYHNNTRGDARYYTQTQLDAGQLDNRYYTESEVDALTWTESDITDLDKYTQAEIATISGSIVNQIITDHGDLDGLADDDHPQYHNNTRGDARYYTQSEIDTKLSETTPITLKDEGGDVTATPHTALNFTGAGVTVSNASSGIATINIPAASGGIEVRDEDVTVTGGPHTVINFTGLLVTASDAGSAQVDVEIPYPSFGTWYGWGGESSQQTTNSTSWVQAARVNVPSIPHSYFRVGWMFEWRRNNVSSDFKARVQLDDSDTIVEMNEESKDVNSWHIASGFAITEWDAGTHTIDIDFCGENSSYTNYIRNIRVEFWKVEDAS